MMREDQFGVFLKYSLPAVIVGLFLYLMFLLRYPLPAGIAGFYLEMAEEIASNGFALPHSISGYTQEDIPFTYPPLALYLIAILNEIGISYLTQVRILPGLIYVATVLPATLLFREFLNWRRTALGTVLLVSYPLGITVYFGGNGLVRGTAFFLAVCAVAAGVRIFRRERDWRWIAIGGISFGLTVLTHPGFALFVVVSYLTIFAVESRSWQGFGSGFAVALIGLGIAMPWLLTVVSNHGLGPILAASGTRGGLITPWRLFNLVQIGSLKGLSGGAIALFILPVIGGSYLVLNNKFLLPVWSVTATVFHGAEYVIAILIPMSVIAVFEVILPALQDTEYPGVLSTWFVVALILILQFGPATLVAADLGGGGPDTDSSPDFLERYLTEEDLDAASWLEENSGETETFVAIGDSAEWIGFLSNRTMVVSPWGSEWLGNEAYQRQQKIYNNLDSCRLPSCYSTTIERSQIDADYLYLQKSSLAGTSADQERILELFAESEVFTHAYENERVIIFKYVG